MDGSWWNFQFRFSESTVATQEKFPRIRLKRIFDDSLHIWGSQFLLWIYRILQLKIMLRYIYLVPVNRVIVKNMFGCLAASRGTSEVNSFSTLKSRTNQILFLTSFCSTCWYYQSFQYLTYKIVQTGVDCYLNLRGICVTHQLYVR